MADQEADVIAKLAAGISGLNAGAWDRLGAGDPFISHAFLSALEESQSVGQGTGWTPAPILIEDEADHLLAAAPAYLKTHSQGEYVFDHGWAEAWERAGGQYYPKLQIAVPFTPVPGPRLLGSRPQQLLAAAEAVTVQNELSSAHITFIDEAGASEAERRGWLIRHGIQYHWFNRGYRSFDDFLGALTALEAQVDPQGAAGCARGPRSPDAARERDRSCRLGRDVGLLPGHRLKKVGPALPDARVLRDHRREAGRRSPAVACLSGLAAGSPVRSISSASDTLYGRYWGCTEEVPFLHFELCYYRAIEWAIDHGLACVQAGAQGEHKVARGYEPVITKSAHFIPNRSFREAVAEFVESGTARRWLPSLNGCDGSCPIVPLRRNRPDRPAARVGHAAIHRRVW